MLLDQAWQDPDQDISDGVDEKSQTSLLRLDAMLMRTHLNLRKLLEVGSEQLPRFRVWGLEFRVSGA